MDNPTFFSVVRRAGDTDWDFTDAGLFGSLQAARDETAKYQANTDVPEMEFAAAVITMLDQDPVTGTPLGHLAPPNAVGYALASLSVADPQRRSVGRLIYKDAATARLIAQAARARNRASENDKVLDVVAVTVVDPAA